MPPKSSEYGATPDTEKGESDEDTPRLMCWCFHATRRMLRRILLLVPLCVVLNWLYGLLILAAIGGAAPLSEDFLVFLARANIFFLPVYLVYITLVWFLLGWDEPFPRYLKYVVLVLFVNFFFVYFYDVEHLYKVRLEDCMRLVPIAYDYPSSPGSKAYFSHGCEHWTRWSALQDFTKQYFTGDEPFEWGITV